MSTLQGKNISSTYQTLLKTSANTGVNSTMGNVEDGVGTKSALNISTTAVSVDGKLGIGTLIPSQQLHIVTSGAQPLLVEDGTGNDQFYVGDASSIFNVKMGDITGSSAGNDTVLYVKDSSSSIIATTTNFGINNDTPSHALHVGNNSGTAKFSLTSSTTAFDINNLFTVDTTNNKVTVDGDLIVEKSFSEAPERYTLKEFFEQRPGVNGSVGIAFNRNYEITGTNASDDDVTWNAGAVAGLYIQTDGASGDDIIVQPHTDSNQTAWKNIGWNTSKSLIYESYVQFIDVTDMAFMSGLKVTNAWNYATDADQAYFYFATGDTVEGATNTLTDNTKLHFIYSVSGTDYITNLGLSVSANDKLRLKIEIDANRQVSVFVNGAQYGLVTSATAGGGTAASSTTKSNALTDDTELEPFTGISALAASTKAFGLIYKKLSMLI
jgi:hypothetical protein